MKMPRSLETSQTVDTMNQAAPAYFYAWERGYSCTSLVPRRRSISTPGNEASTDRCSAEDETVSFSDSWMSSSRQIPCARALYNFDGQAEHELSFSVGMSLHLLRRVDENWLEGELAGRIGIFPASHVHIELGSPSLARENDLASSGKPYALALFSFSGEENGDLSFNKGELVELLGPVASGWLRGKIGAREGIFPSSFVQILRAPEVKGKAEEEQDRPIPKPRSNVSHTPVVCNGTDAPTPTPSRSAPAPPTSQHLNDSTQDSYSSSTLPKPKPRRLARHLSSSTTQHHIHSLEANLAIEQKMMESAQNLMTICQNEVKRDKLKEAVRKHRTRAEKLKEQIREARAQQDALVMTQPRPPPPPSPPTPSQPLLPEQQRLKVIEELISTEKDFHHQMDVCCQEVVPALARVPGVNVEGVFGNIEDIACLSGRFQQALEEACGEQQQMVGKVFLTFAPQMGDVYAVYCRNQDSAASLLEKCMETPEVAEKIKASIDPIRHEVQAWDLQSLLIKPVQRVLKYPLLLDKLVEFTEDGHPDRRAVQGARDAAGQVARDINELKRRRDIVERYTGATREERRVSMSMHSLQKKVRRLQQTITQKTGLRSKTVDPKFDELEQRVTQLEGMVRNLLKDIQAWLDGLQHATDSKETLFDGMGLYCSSLHTLSNFKSMLSQLQQNVRSHVRFVTEHVVTPLQSLLELFLDPVHLISKRRDKLLDYDHVQYALEHAEEPEKIKQLREDCLLAKRNYEALNAQLLEELPHFHQLTLRMLSHLLKVLVQSQYTFHSAISTVLETLTGSIQTSSSIQQHHAVEVSKLAQQLVQLSVVPASLSMNFMGVSISPSNRRASTASEDYPMLLHVPSSSSGAFHCLQEEEVESSPELPKGTVMVVLYDFDAQDRAELDVDAGQLVTLLCPHDRIGCREWWLVSRGPDKGYVPATYLTEAVTR